MNIFVGNLDFQTTEEELENIFTPYGNVDSVKIITDKYTGRPRGFGFVEMPVADEAKKAIEGLNNYSLSSRNIVVNEARPRENSNSRGGFNSRNRY